MKVCEKCGEQNIEENKFCVNCGNIIGQNTIKSSQKRRKTKKKRGSAKREEVFDTLGCIILIIIIIVAGTFFYLYFENFLQFIISIVVLIIVLGCVFEIIGGTIQEIYDRIKKRKENKTETHEINS